DTALAIEPNFPEAVLNRCGCLRGLNRVDEAMTGLERLIASNPNYAEAHFTFGMMLADANRAAEAIASYERAVTLKPAHTKARWSSCMASLPILYAETDEIGRQRTEYERRLDA